MSIDVNRGRAKSHRTSEEEEELLRKELETLTPEEQEVLQKILHGISNPGDAQARDLYKVLSNAEWKTTPVDMKTFVRDPYFLGNTCDALYPVLENDLTELFSGGYREAIFTGCIEMDALVQSSNGALRTSREWVGHKGEVVGFSTAGAVNAKTGTAKSSGTLPVVRMLLANGMEQRLTPDHKVMVWREEYVWVPAEELVCGDWVVCPRAVEVIPDANLSVDEARLLAYWCTNGCSDDRRSRYASGNEATVNEVLSLLSAKGFCGKKHRLPYSACWEVYVEEHRRSGFLCWLRDHEGHYKTADVRVPEAVCRSSLEVVAAFINRVWAAEGTVYAGTKGSPPRFVLGMTSERFVRQIQLLLLRFGIASRIRFTPQYDKRTGVTTETWLLSVQGSGPMRTFLEKIGAILGKEVNSERIRAYCARVVENTNADIVPIRRHWLGKEMSLRGIRRSAESRWWGLQRGSGSYLSRSMFNAWLEEFGTTELGKELSERFPTDFAFHPLVELESCGEAEVGDICDVYGANSFVSNGIYSHNSIGYGKTFAASIGVCRTLYELSCMRDPHRSFGIAPNSNISLVCLSVNEVLATKVAYENIATKIEASPYFQEHFPFEKTKKELRFPKHIWVAARATTDNSVLGLNVVGGLLDECLVGKSEILLWEGTSKPIADLACEGVAVVETFDFDRNEAIPAVAYAKRSADQECFELLLDNGMRIAGSADHPVAIQTSDGRLVYNMLRDIVDGQEIVVYGKMDGRAEGRACGSDAGVVEHGSLRRSQTVGRGEGADVCGYCSASCGGSCFCASLDARKLESHVWEEAYRRSKEADKRASDREEALRVRQEAYVRAKEGTRYPLVGVQAGVVRTQSGTQGRVSAHRRDEAAHFGIERVETSKRRLPLRRLGRYAEGGSCWVSEPVRITSHRAIGSGWVSESFRVRETGSVVLLEREEAAHVAGFPYMGVRGPGYRSEASRLHLPFQREGQDAGRSDVLRGARLGIRSLGRALSVARVVSKRSLGVQPTYDLSVPGYETYVADGVLVHNTNFMRTSRAKDPRFNIEGQAQSLYNAMMRRMKSRFERKGKLPGILFVVSSKQTHDDFTAKRIDNSRGDPLVFVRDYALWDVKPDAYFTGDWFSIVVGNEQSPSRILRDEEDPDEVEQHLADGCVLIRVPEDFKHDFERDLEGAIRDLAGIATVSVSPFIQRREKIAEAVDPGRTHPFTTEVYDPSTSATFQWHKMVRPSADAALDAGYGDDIRLERPILNPLAPRYLHIDPSLSGDATGFCMAHIGGWKTVTRRDAENMQYGERAPVLVVDLILRIVPPIGDELVLGDIRKLVYQLSRRGYMITRITMDSYQSAEAIQKFNQKGYNAELLSMDRSTAPYETLKSALYENRILYYDYPPLMQELRELEHDRAKKKIDHPPRGSKDCADALAGVVFSLTENSSTMPLPMLKSLPDMGGDIWLAEQHHMALAQAENPGNTMDVGLSVLPPFLVGSYGSFDDDA